MNNIDSLTLKYFYDENKDFIDGAIVQKIQLPSRYEVIFNLRNLSCNKAQNKKLYININPKYPHICFINDNTASKRDINIPKKPPMFCMQLRKYLNGSKIKDFKLVKYERIFEFYFDYFDEIGSLTRVCLAVELMGKHSNIILYNTSNKIIIGSIHNISQDKSSIREIYGGIKYIYPPAKNKLDILNISYSTFFEIAKDRNINEISNNIYYFYKPLLEKIFNKYNDTLEIFNFMQSLEKGLEKNFIINLWEGKDNINDSIDNYFADFIFSELMNQYKAKFLKTFQKDYKKLSNILNSKPNDSQAQKYKQFADYIMAYSYKINKNDEFLFIDNLKIELDTKLTPAKNAQKYYERYKKAKTAFEFDKKRYNEAKEKLEYLNSIKFNIENATSFDDLKGTKEELIKLGYISNDEKINKTQTPITKINYKGFDIYIGKNNKQNDYLISKIASSEDLWFHGQGFTSSHVILKILNNKKEPDREVLEYCAKLTKENSKAKFSGKTPIIMTKRKFLKKPPDSYPGYVTYKNETEIIID